jgi:DNA-binding response OmpR family regulator
VVTSFAEEIRLRDQKIRFLEEEIATLKNEIVLLKEVVTPDLNTAVEMRLKITRTEAALLSMFIRNPVILTKEAAYLALYGGRTGEWPEIKILDVLVCKFKKRLHDQGAPMPLTETIWGRGWRLTDEGRDWLENRLSDGKAA